MTTTTPARINDRSMTSNDRYGDQGEGQDKEEDDDDGSGGNKATSPKLDDSVGSQRQRCRWYRRRRSFFSFAAVRR